MAELATTESNLPEGYDNGNIFAKILRGEIPSYKVFETDHAYAMLDAFPVTRFHCLIIPKAPSIDASDLSPENAAGFFKDLPMLVSIVKKASGAPAVKVISNCGAEAGQEVFHTHFHIIPKFKKGESGQSSSGMVNSEEATESVTLLRAQMPKVADSQTE
mmetsp:Transcript_10510/g.12781  ORF Transcript_10510/g.12781 Transcript_10510/m.12781 type:complete len:160 (-) Transcript_10510:126-605(-)|eukprot:CAMPEP_0114404018 /NCGR_PEP_ID=MMETSP0102-20121206/19275_1 /TAXON_ID=38822 ORGANISM="Pteridomonas danica, Strain PT" /NCGR_SAMPLE_ID=MMETSP0102 /ASSEMBLY_ACC=CAM_ASM_000212 /LENGTH=159 /DNA_ID=CAMNT_0001568571 /DNA_START=8 /DNA_END=487 /DNA_ORIENTATION=+